MIDYTPAVHLAHHSRWAGTKDGDRSRSRALACNTHLDQGGPFSALQAATLKDRLKESGLGPASVNRHLSAYFAVWRTLVQRGLLQHGPPSGLLCREPRGRVRVVTADEVHRLAARMEPEYVQLVRFLAETGCRVSEALGLLWQDVDVYGRTATFRDTKNSDDRTVPLPESAVPCLQQSVDGRPFGGCTQSGLNHAWADARVLAGLSGDTELVPHALRHTYASRLVAAGVPLPVVAKLLGHRSIRTTMRYVHCSLSDCTAALQKAGVL